MSCIRKRAHEAPSKCESPIDGFVRWRAWMKSDLEGGGRVTMGTVYAIRQMMTCREKLAPAAWIPCPECHERGLWMEDGRQRWCHRCYGTGILLVCEQDVPKSEKAAPTGWRSRLQGLGHLNLRRNITTRRRS